MKFKLSGSVPLKFEGTSAYETGMNLRMTSVIAGKKAMMRSPARSTRI